MNRVFLHAKLTIAFLSGIYLLSGSARLIETAYSASLSGVSPMSTGSPPPTSSPSPTQTPTGTPSSSPWPSPTPTTTPVYEGSREIESLIVNAFSSYLPLSVNQNTIAIDSGRLTGNQPPVAVLETVSVFETAPNDSQALTILLNVNDDEPITVSPLIEPLHANPLSIDSETKTAHYIFNGLNSEAHCFDDPEFIGQDAFVYIADDTDAANPILGGRRAPGVVTVIRDYAHFVSQTQVPLNRADLPSIESISTQTAFAAPLLIDVKPLIHSLHPSDASVSLLALPEITRGMITENGNGVYLYQPNQFFGHDYLIVKLLEPQLQPDGFTTFDNVAYGIITILVSTPAATTALFDQDPGLDPEHNLGATPLGSVLPAYGGASVVIDPLAYAGETEHTFFIKSVDHAKKVVKSSYTFIIDNTPPQLDWAAPQPDEQAPLIGDFPFNFSVLDDISPRQVDMFVNSSLLPQEIFSPFAAIYDTTQLSDGVNTFAFRAVDQANNVSTYTLTFSGHVDNLPPVTEVRFNGELVASGNTPDFELTRTVELAIQSMDEGTTVVRVDVVPMLPGLDCQPLALGAKTCLWDTTQTIGYQQLQVIAEDVAHHISTSYINVAISNYDPVVNLFPTGALSVNEGDVVVVTMTITGAGPGQSLTHVVSGAPPQANFQTAPGAVLSTFTWQPTYEDAGVYSIDFVARDAALYSSTQTLTLTVRNVNRAPALPFPGDKTVAEGERLMFTLNPATDADGNTVYYSVSSKPSQAAFDPQTRLFDWTPDFSQSGDAFVVFVATDNGGPNLVETSTRIAVHVLDVNQRPALSASSNIFGVSENSPLLINLTVSDADNDPLTCHYQATPALPGTPVLASQPPCSLSWLPDYDSAGSYQVEFSVTDDHNGAHLSSSDSVTIEVSNTNRAPQISPLPAQNVTVGVSTTITIPAIDLDGDAVVGYSVFPIYMEMSFTGNRFTWIPSDPGPFTLTFSAADLWGAEGSVDVLFNVSPVTSNNLPPVITIPMGADITMKEGENLNIDINVTDPDSGQAVMVSAAGAPSWSHLRAVPTGAVLELSAHYASSGTYPIHVTATDNGNPALNSVETIYLTVQNTNRTPRLEAIGSRVIREGEPLAINLTAHDDDTAEVLNFSMTWPLPANATFNSASGEFRWTPDYTQGRGDNYSLGFWVTDAAGMISSETVPVTVQDLNQLPYFTALPASQRADAESSFSFSLLAKDADSADAISYSFTSIPEMAGASLGNQTGVFSWTPTPSQAGDYLLTLTASDNHAGASASTSTVLAVVVNGAPVMTPLSDFHVRSGDSVNFQAAATDINSDPLHFQLIEGPLNAALSNDGYFTYRAGAEGVYPVRLRVSDGHLAAEQAMTITVDMTPPTLTGIPDDGQLIRMSTLNIHGHDDGGKTFITVRTTDSPPLVLLSTQSGGLVDLRQLAEGTHTLIFDVRDEAGNSTSVTRTLNRVIPRLTLLPLSAPAGIESPSAARYYINSHYGSSALTIYAQASVPLEAGQTATLRVNGQDHPMSSANGSDFEFRWTLPVADGLNIVEAVLTEAAYQSTLSTFMVTADREPPVINPIHPSFNCALNYGQCDTNGDGAVEVYEGTFRASAQDNLGLDRVEFFINNDNLNSPTASIGAQGATQGVFSKLIDLEKLKRDFPSAPLHTFKMQAIDQAGNRTVLSNPISFAVVGAPSSIFITHPSSGIAARTDADAQIYIDFVGMEATSVSTSAIQVSVVQNGKTSDVSGVTRPGTRTGRYFFDGIIPANCERVIWKVSGVETSNGRTIELLGPFEFSRPIAQSDGGSFKFLIDGENNSAPIGELTVVVPPSALMGDQYLYLKTVDQTDAAIEEAKRKLEATQAGVEFKRFFRLFTSSRAANSAGFKENYELAKNKKIQLLYHELNAVDGIETQKVLQLLELGSGNVWVPRGTSQLAGQSQAYDPRKINPIELLQFSTIAIASILPPSAEDPGRIMIGPNPFNPMDSSNLLKIVFVRGLNSEANVVIYDLFGNLVRRLEAPADPNQAYMTLTWDGKNGEGRVVANGGYILYILVKDSSGQSSKTIYKVGVVK